MSRPSELLRLAAESSASEAILGELRAAVAVAASARQLPGEALSELRLFSGARRRDAKVARAGASSSPALLFAAEPSAPRALGVLFESLLARATNRKRSGSFFTPAPLAERVVARALERSERSTAPVLGCDPALGGGAFLLALGEALVARSTDDDTPRLRRRIVERCLTGVDVSPLAVAVTEAALWLWAADPDLDPGVMRRRLLVADALERGWERPLLGERSSFDLVLGNPPWVAFAGRAAKPLAPSERKRLAREYQCFRGYPTLHAMFVERAAELAPDGVVALLVPSPLADLDGYRPVRSVLARTHVAREPMLELGQDAFEGVTQPCFALIADPGASPRGDAPWRLVERQRALAGAEEVAAPAILGAIASLPSFPRELFGEMGFQSAGAVSKTLFRRADEPDERHSVPLLEGREVREFHVGAPRLYLWPEPEVLARARCRLRDSEQYRRVPFVVRQTAKYPIAALHSGAPFRNSLLAGFSHPELSPALVVALLNSALYRALHLALRRDARQAAFPQVKVAHLRALPRPPRDAASFERLEAITASACREGLSAALRAELDGEVFALFGLCAADRMAVERFLAARAPELVAARATSPEDSGAARSLVVRGGRRATKVEQWS